MGVGALRDPPAKRRDFEPRPGILGLGDSAVGERRCRDSQVAGVSVVRGYRTEVPRSHRREL